MSASVNVVAFESELNSIVKEYLEAGSYERTANTFEKECEESNKPIAVTKVPLRSNSSVLSLQNEMIQHFQFGQSQKFLDLWEENLPESLRNTDSVAQKLEFYVHIYFAIYPMKHGAGDQISTDAGMAAFKTYLETRGSTLSQTTEFLPYYALPFVPNPRAHPSYKELFSDIWVPDLQERLEKFLTLALRSRPQPRIFDLYNNSGSAGPTRDVLEKMQGMQQQVIDSERKVMTYVKRYNKMQADYHNLIGITADLVDSLEQTIQGNTISPEYLQRICSRLFTNHMRQSMSVSMDLTRPGTAAQVLRASIAATPVINRTEENLLASLDYDKIKRDFGTLPNRQKALLLQALRWRLSRSVPGEQRDTILAAYVDNDLLGCAMSGHHREAIFALLSSNEEVVRQYAARLFNAFASLCDGRTYLSLNHELLRGLMSTLTAEDKDPITRENVLGALQKLSLRRGMQSAMIEAGIIQWLVRVLEDNDSMSDYTLEYSVALLMNLCLRTSGKRGCAKSPHKVLEVLSNLLGHENHEILPYVNGALYSILGIPVIRDEAKAMDMEEMLKCFIKDDTPDMNRQLEFIIKQLHSNENMEDVDSDDEEDDDEDEDDQDAMEADLDKAEVFKPGPDELVGERLLTTEYLGLMTNAVNRKNKQLAAVRGHPMQRPVTPGQVKGQKMTLVSDKDDQSPVQPRSANGLSRPASNASRPGTRVDRPSSHASRPGTGDRPPTRSGSQQATTEDEESLLFHTDAEGSELVSRMTGVTRKLAAPESASSTLSQRALSKGGSASEYSAGFSTRPRILRSSDGPISAQSRAPGSPRQTPQPRYSASLPRPSTQDRGRNSGKQTGTNSRQAQTPSSRGGKSRAASGTKPSN